MLTKAQIDEYWDTGCVVVEGVLSKSDVEELRRVTDEFVEGARGITENNDVYDLEETHTSERPRVRRIKAPDRQHPAYGNLVRHPRLVEALCDLWGPDVRFHGAKLNMKSAGFGAAVEWHQDWAFYPHTNEDLAAVGIMMDDMVVANGPLMVIPGSHKGPLYDHHSKGVFVGAFDPKKIDLDMSKAVPLVGPAGSITIHHARAIHCSALNTSERDRRLLLFQYRAADAWPLLAEEQPKAMADFDKMMVAGKPREPRLVSGIPVQIPRHSPTYKSGAGIYALQKGAETKYFDVIEAPKTKKKQAAM
jgi:phytanoyl-CoA hydroxylase